MSQQERQAAVKTCKEFLTKAFKPVLPEQHLNNLFLYKEIVEEDIPVVEEVVIEEGCSIDDITLSGKRQISVNSLLYLGNIYQHVL